MDDYSQFEFVEARNAPNDHRVVVQGRGPAGSFGTHPGQRTFVAQPRSPYGQPQHQVIYAHPGIGVGVGGSGSSLFGRMSTGQVIDMVAQIFAALMPLPAAPSVTSIADTDSGNLILYQSSLAQYAKRDEQVRTLGNLITKLVG
jgi:hypothetical protein